jgi:nicotinamidase-related amidase
MRDALVVIDVINDFAHPDGAALLDSFRARQPVLVESLEDARARDVPVIYVNDSHDSWDWDVAGWIERTTRASPAPELVQSVAPRAGDAFLRKPRYSAFDQTPLELVLERLQIERILLVGSATEMCIVQSAIDARELGLKVTILAAACASVDADDEQLALAYAERVAGVFVERGRVTLPTA